MSYIAEVKSDSKSYKSRYPRTIIAKEGMMKGIKYYSICVLMVIILLSSVSWAEKTELTGEEKQWLSEHKIIKIAPDPFFPPIEHIDKDGNYTGISAEFMKIIENDLGIKFQVIHCKDWDEVLQKAKNREVDMLPAAAQTPQREDYMLFSTPYLEFPGVIIVKKVLKILKKPNNYITKLWQ